jgi:Predicted permease
LGASIYSTPFGVTVILGAGTLLLLFLLKTMGSVIAPILFTFTLAVTVAPFIKRLERRGMGHGLAVAAVFLGAFCVAAVILAIIVGQLTVFTERIPQYQAILSQNLAPVIARAQELGIAKDTFASGTPLSPDALARAGLQFARSILAQLGTFAVFLFLMLVMAAEGPAVGRTLETHVPPHSPLVIRYRAFLHEVQAQYRIATLSNSVSAVALTIAYLAFRIDFALLWGLLTFFLSYIPRFGMLVSFIPPVLMALVLHGPSTALSVLLLAFAINIVMDNVITPRLTGKGLSLRLSVVAIAAIVWLWVFGALGAILSVSLMLFIRMILASSPQTLPLAYALSTESYAPPDVTPEPEAKAPK